MSNSCKGQGEGGAGPSLPPARHARPGGSARWGGYFCLYSSTAPLLAQPMFAAFQLGYCVMALKV
ncbi:hypothetical protein GCM10008960_30540 [Deinococcus sedimenti]|uniref:Uncharacterized protein n=1 Tax=Deinococcus sedimenti TaxID=1867090 RepID=A0ABQ2S977_9DEIO|nr:hypothetical protein GCM10008960_30540 [Deinococcus sedimenti]